MTSNCDMLWHWTVTPPRRRHLEVLRNGVKDSGCKFRLAYFRPASGLNKALRLSIPSSAAR